jgi:hypothetical protein
MHGTWWPFRMNLTRASSRKTLTTWVPPMDASMVSAAEVSADGFRVPSFGKRR